MFKSKAVTKDKFLFLPEQTIKLFIYLSSIFRSRHAWIFYTHMFSNIPLPNLQQPNLGCLLRTVWCLDFDSSQSHREANIETKETKFSVFTPLQALPSSASQGSREQGRCWQEWRKWWSVNGCSAASHSRKQSSSLHSVFLDIQRFFFLVFFSDQEEFLFCPRMLKGAQSRKKKPVSPSFQPTSNLRHLSGALAASGSKGCCQLSVTSLGETRASSFSLFTWIPLDVFYPSGAHNK